MASTHYLRLHERDNIAVATAALPNGTCLSDLDLTLSSDILSGHKFATADIAAGHPVLKYGHFIGAATCEALNCQRPSLQIGVML